MRYLLFLPILRPLGPMLVVLAVSAALLTACAAPERDLSYRESRLLPPLEVPAGLASPDYSGQMMIPSTGPGAANAPLPDPDVIERPPNLLEQQ